MKVYVAPCGLGLGHIMRCEPVARKLQSKGVDVVFSTYLDGLDYAKRAGFKLMESVSISFQVKLDGTIDFKRTAATSGFSLGFHRFMKQVTGEIKNMRSYGPDVVLSDSRASSLVAARMLGLPTVLILNQYRVDIVDRPTWGSMSLFDRFFFIVANVFWVFIRTLIEGVWALSQIILIPDWPSPFTISIGNLAIPTRYAKKVKFIGPLVTAKQVNEESQARLKRSIGVSAEKPLVYAGVSGPKVERKYLADTLIEIFRSFPRDYEIILSRGDPRGSAKHIRVGNLKVFDWIENQIDYVRACDALVGRAGHGTIVKAITCGKPIVLIPIPDHMEQHRNAQRAVELGVAKIVAQENLNSSLLLEAIVEVLSSGVYANRSAAAAKMARELDGIGVATELTLHMARHS